MNASDICVNDMGVSGVSVYHVWVADICMKIFVGMIFV